MIEENFFGLGVVTVLLQVVTLVVLLFILLKVG